jgi:hypothetical protein
MSEYNLKGKKLNNGKVLKQVPKPDHLVRAGHYWLVKCNCGNECVVDTTTVIHKWHSCGCIQKKNLIRRFEKGVVKKLIGSEKNKRRWLLECDCSNEYDALSESLLSGNTKSCGCLNNRIHCSKDTKNCLEIIGAS